MNPDQRFITALLGVLACEPAPRDQRSAVNDTASPPAHAPPVARRTDSVVAQPVHRTPTMFETALRAAGFEPTPSALRGRDPFPNVAAAAYRVGAVNVEAYFFADPIAAARSAGRLRPPNGGVTMFTSNNALVVLTGGDTERRTRIRRALTAPEAEGGVSR